MLTPQHCSNELHDFVSLWSPKRKSLLVAFSVWAIKPLPVSITKLTVVDAAFGMRQNPTFFWLIIVTNDSLLSRGVSFLPRQNSVKFMCRSFILWGVITACFFVSKLILLILDFCSITSKFLISKFGKNKNQKMPKNAEDFFGL